MSISISYSNNTSPLRRAFVFYKENKKSQSNDWDFKCAKEKSERRKVRSDVEAPPGLEPGVKVLQTSALPLGYGATLPHALLYAAARKLMNHNQNKRRKF